MEIKDLKANKGSVDIVAQVVTKDSPRDFDKFGKKGQVCNATLKDGTGQVKMTLWNDEVQKVNVGDKIHLQNGWCSEFKGEIQVSAGKFGKIEIIEAGTGKQVFTNDADILGQEKGLAGKSGDEDGDDEEENVEEFIED